MEQKIKEQILAIRDTGLTNMFDIGMVQRLAYERDFYELVLYLEKTVWPCDFSAGLSHIFCLNCLLIKGFRVIYVHTERETKRKRRNHHEVHN